MVKKYYFDFDETIYRTSKAIIEYFEKRGYKLKKGYNEENCLNDIMSSFGIEEEKVREMFSDKDLYTYEANNFYEGSLELIESLLEDGHYVSIVTVGERSNNQNKKDLMAQLIPDLDFQFKNFEFKKGMTKEEMYDKSCFDMSGGYHLDDKVICLQTSNAKVKTLFKTKNESFKTVENFEQFIEQVI